MTAFWITVGLLAVTTALIKGAGPVVLGGRELPERFSGVVVLMAPALLTALIVTSTFADGDEWRVGAVTAGVAAGAKKAAQLSASASLTPCSRRVGMSLARGLRSGLASAIARSVPALICSSTDGSVELARSMRPPNTTAHRSCCVPRVRWRCSRNRRR